MDNSEKGIPVVQVVRVGGYEGDGGERFIILKCPFCGKRHVHGASPGHRSPHCTPREKAPPNGYTLSEVGPEDYQELDDL